MQNLKPLEDYKKQKQAASGDSDEKWADDASSPSFSKEVPSQLEVEPNAPRPYMVITNLKKICDQANQLIGMINECGKVEQWAVDHITTSADDIEEVYNYFKYKD
jgi:hypothetical protein